MRFAWNQVIETYLEVHTQQTKNKNKTRETAITPLRKKSFSFGFVITSSHAVVSWATHVVRSLAYRYKAWSERFVSNTIDSHAWGGGGHSSRVLLSGPGSTHTHIWYLDRELRDLRAGRPPLQQTKMRKGGNKKRTKENRDETSRNNKRTNNI